MTETDNYARSRAGILHLESLQLLLHISVVGQWDLFTLFEPIGLVGKAIFCRLLMCIGQALFGSCFLHFRGCSGQLLSGFLRKLLGQLQKAARSCRMLSGTAGRLPVVFCQLLGPVVVLSVGPP